MSAKPLTRISDQDEQALYERYIAPVAAIAEGFDMRQHFVDSPKLNGLEEYSPNVHIIADVIAWSYLGTLKPLPHNSVMTMLRLLDESAKRQYANAKSAKKKAAHAHERLLGAVLVETVLTEMIENAPFSGDFLFYHMMAVMQLSVALLGVEKMTDAEQAHHFISMRVCLERGNFSQILLLQNKTHSPKELAQRGGKQKFVALYGAAHAYTKQRRDEILAAKPHTSKMQIAKIIHEEAENLAEFRVMSKENRERTIYDWVRKM
jgi:hypothetical protein